MECGTIRGVSETLFIPLLGRATATRFYPHIRLKDPLAEELISKIDYDFSDIARDRRAMYGLAKRAEVLDNLCLSFLAQHPDGIVLSLGSGLSTQLYRVDNGQVRWHDVDFEAVIELRKNLLPFHERQSNHAMSVLEFDKLQDLIQTFKQPTLVICEGLLMYLKESEVQQLLYRLGEILPPDSVLIFDAFTQYIVGREYLVASVQKSGANFQWGMKTLRHAERWSPKLRFQSYHLFVDSYKFAYRILGRVLQLLIRTPVYSIYRYQILSRG